MSGRSQFRFRLYTAEGTRNAIRARADHIRMTPTLIKLSPDPGGRIVGSLHAAPVLLAALDISVDPA